MNNQPFVSKFKRGVSLLHKFDDALYYSMQCDCGDHECGSIIEIECDEGALILCNFYKDVQFDFWTYPNNPIKRFFYRWKSAIILAFTGRISLHGSFVIQDAEHITNFAEALLEGRDYCLNRRNQREE